MNNFKAMMETPSVTSKNAYMWGWIHGMTLITVIHSILLVFFL